jgi:glycosyltransferase involved in cell wall biosynthesis
MDNDITIYQISSRYMPHFSGPSIQAHKINKRILSQNIRIKVITQNEREKSNSIDGIEILRIPAYGLKGLFDTKVGKLIWSIMVCLYLIKDRKKIDVIHVLDSFFTSIFFSITAKIIKKPIVLKNSINGIYSCNSLYRRIKFLILRSTSNVISISKKTFDDTIACGFNSNKVFRIPNGVDINVFKKSTEDEKKALRKKHMISEYSYIGLFTGSIIDRKGIKDIVSAWHLISEIDKNCLLLLVGSTSDKIYLNEIERYIKDNKLSSNIKIMGNRSDIHEFYKLADIYLFASFREGLPNSLMEAMASELPICARGIDGVTDLIDESSGVIINTGNTFNIELSRAIMNFKQNLELSEIHGQNARNKIIEDYSLESVTKKYELMYKTLS